MIGYIASSVIALLNFFATAEGVHSYIIWGMGNFGGVSMEQLPFFLRYLSHRIAPLLIIDKTPECPSVLARAVPRT